MADESPGMGRWREGGPPRRPERTGPSAAAKWIGTAIVSTLLLAAVVGMGWLAFQLWFATGPRPYFVAFWVGPYDRPEIPPIAWLDADRRALVEDRIFPNPAARPGADDRPTLEVMRKRLDDLAARGNEESVVVYLSACAVVDPDRKIRILAADSAPYEANTQLPLAWVLERLKGCPSRNKLLVLDIMRSMLDPRDVGGTADGVAGVLAEELRDDADPARLFDPDLMVLASCEPGETAIGSEDLKHSVFGYYFHRALTTEEADADADGAVSARELAAYLGGNVDAWAMHFRGRHQRPVLLGRERGDFLVASTRRTRPAATPGLIAAAEKSKEAAEAKAPTAEEKPKEKEAKAKEAEPASAYPAWLANAWELAEGWWKAGDFQAAPRVYRRLTRELIRAELRWRGGEPEDLVHNDLGLAIQDLTIAMKHAEDIPRPPIRSAGQAVAFGHATDPALSAALAAPIRMRHDLPDDSPDLAKAVKDALAKFQGRGGLDLAAALIEAAQDEVLNPKTLAFLDGIVEQSRAVLDPARPARDVLELMFLHQLAQRARVAGEWKPDVARIAWRTVAYAEQANSRPEALAWVRGGLDEADAALHEARVLLLPVSEAVGYASWRQIAEAWDGAWTRYQLVGEQQRAVRDGRAALARAMAVLVGLIPYLEARPDGGLQADWMEAIAMSGELARRLEPPTDRRPAEPGAVAALSGSAGRLDALTRRLLAPSRPEAVRAILEQVRSSAAPEPALASQIVGLLLDPFLAVEDRRALYDAGRALHDRLGQTWRPGEPAAGPLAEGRGTPLREAARRRFDRLVALLDLAGDPTSAHRLDEFRKAIESPGQAGGADPAWDLSDPARAWAALARSMTMAYNAFGQALRPDTAPDGPDRAGWLAPAYIPGFGAWSSAPTRRVREREALAAWDWLAAHYRHESRDLHDLLDPDGLLEVAARECPTDERARPEVAIRIDAPTSAIRLTPSRPSATVDVRLLLTGPGATGPEKVAVDVLEPEDPRLRVTVGGFGRADVSPTAPIPVSIEVTLADDPTRAGTPPPGGLLVRARRLDGRTDHALIPLSIASADMLPRLALSRDPKECDDTPMDRLRLRPIAGLRQPFHVFVKNPSDRAWNVVVEVLEGEGVLCTSGAKPIEMAAHSTRPVPGFGVPAAPKPGVELREPAGPLRLRLRDAGGTVLDESPLGVGIASPTDTIEVTRADFAPDAPGQPNRLTVVFRPLPTLAGPPCPVELVLPTDAELFPALRDPPRAGKLTGELKPGGEELTLYAEGLLLTPGDPRGAFSLDVDGVRGALWYRARFPQVGGPQGAVEMRRPRVRLRARTRVEPEKPAELEVDFRVDEAPPGARLDVRLGQSRDGQLGDDLTWRAAAKRRHLGFDPGGEGGALLFEAAIADQRWTRPIPGLVGPRRLQARLLDEAGRIELDSAEADIVLDDRLPGATSIELPEKIARGTRELTARLSVAPTPSKIRDVSLIFGPKSDFDKAVAEGKTFPARAVDPEGRDWSATLPVPADAPSKLVVTARFTTGVGLTAYQSGEVLVFSPPTAEETKPAPPKPGSIAGKVMEGDRPQPGLIVFLLDPDLPANDPKRVVGRRTTDAKGAFTFADLKPKAYRVTCRKLDGINNRSAEKPVTVEPGKPAAVELALTR